MDPRLDELARRYGIRMILQFGSSVSGPVHDRSDVDVAVLLDRSSPSLREQDELAAELQALFPGREIDLAVLNRADPLFLKKILERCRLLYRSPRAVHDLRLYAFRRYQDHREYLALERRYVARALGEAESR